MGECLEVNQEVLKELFDYHKDGYLVNKKTRGRSAKEGQRVGRGSTKSYRQVRLFGKQFREHRLIWMWHYGSWPTEIDHIDHDRTNNRIENLRDISHKKNIRHGSGRQAGLHFSKRSEKWQAGIYVDCKKIHLGCFDSYEEALACRKEAEARYWT